MSACVTAQITAAGQAVLQLRVLREFLFVSETKPLCGRFLCPRERVGRWLSQRLSRSDG